MSDRWTDEHIDHVYGAGTIGAKWVRDLRDEVEALEAEVAHWRQAHAECTTSLITADRHIARLQERGEWSQLADGEYTRPNWDGNGEVTLSLLHNGEELEFWHSSNPKDVEGISLPPEYRLCQRRAQEGTGAQANE